MTVDDRQQFEANVAVSVAALKAADELKAASRAWIIAALKLRYSHNFRWASLPIIQLPQDMVGMQELLWSIKPELVIETGVARGGSLALHASVLELLGKGTVVGIDIDIRAHNRAALDAHPLRHRMELVEGSSIDEGVVRRVHELARGKGPVVVILDSNHSHEHVLAELRAYAPLVRRGSALIVLDTIIEDMPAEMFPDRPWGPGNSPRTAVRAFLAENERFVVAEDIEAKLQLTLAPGGWLRCVRDPP